jgi:hypothetical protein
MADSKDDKKLAKWIAAQLALAEEAKAEEERRHKAKKEREAREAAERLEEAIKNFPDEIKPYCALEEFRHVIVDLPGLPAFIAWATDGGGWGFYVPYVAVHPDGMPYFMNLDDTYSQRLFGSWHHAIEKLVDRQLEYDRSMELYRAKPPAEPKPVVSLPVPGLVD